MPTFDLVDQPWIPCIRPDGSRQELGLLDTLTDAHEIGEIADPSPLITVALHRLLLAVLHRAHQGPRNLDAWQALWQRGHWDPDIVNSYLADWRHRLDLFHPERPFFQTPSNGDGGTVHPIDILVYPTGKQATLFDHEHDHAPSAFSPAAAARVLLARQTFSIGLGRSDPFYLTDSPALRGYSVLALGDTLFETLALNLLPYNQERPIPWLGDDLPAWEHDPPPGPDPAGTPIRGYVDYLTWQSRRIHLIPEGDDPVIRRCHVRQNLKARDDPLDPFKAYRSDANRGWVPRGLSSSKVVWRDSHALFQQAEASRRPELFNHLARIDGLRQRSVIQARPAYRFSVFGFVTKERQAANIELWRQERLPLPLAYLDDPDLLQALGRALALAESVGRLLAPGFPPRADDPARKAPSPVQILAAALLPSPAGLPPDRAALEHLVDHLAPQPRYWAALDTPFRRLLGRLPTDRTLDEDGEPDYGATELPTWARSIQRAAWSGFDGATRGLDTSARSLKAAAQARRSFAAALSAHLAPYLGDPDRPAEEGDAA